MKYLLILALLVLLISPSVMAVPDLEDQLKGDAYIRNKGAPWMADSAIMYFGTGKDVALTYSAAADKFYVNDTALYLEEATTFGTSISSPALAVTTADKLTVNGVIIPQEMAVPFSYNANSVDIGVFSAIGAWNITAVELVPRVAGNDAAAVNVTIKVCDSGEAPSSGDAALSAVLDLKGTADTTQAGTLGANVACSATQYIALDFTGTLTNAVGMGTIWLKRV